MPEGVDWRLVVCCRTYWVFITYCKNLHIYLREKALLGFGFLSLAESQADSWCKLSVSAAADCSEHTLLLTGLVSSACSSLQALYYQHTETGLPAQVEEASIWLYLLTEMLCRSLVPHLHTHPTVSGERSWPLRLAEWSQEEAAFVHYLLICAQYTWVLHWALFLSQARKCRLSSNRGQRSWEVGGFVILWRL